MSKATPESRIVGQIVTLAVVVVALGSAVWVGRLGADPTVELVLVAHAVAAVALLSTRAYLAGVRFEDVRIASPKARSVFLVALVVVSATSAGIGPLQGASPIQPATAADAVAPDEGNWSGTSDMPSVRSHHAAATLNGAIYVVSGLDSGGYTTSVIRYWPENDTWESAASIPAAVHSHEAAATDSALYVAGGSDSGGSTVDTVYKYDPSSDSWTQVASLPTARENHNMEVLNGHVYVIGGQDADSSYNRTTLRYYPSNDTWVEAASLVDDRADFATAVYDGKIYALGGRDPSSYQCDGERYFPSNNSWVKLQNSCMNQGTKGHTAVEAGGKIYVYGGEDSGGNELNLVEKYHPGNDTYTWAGNMSTARKQVSGGEVNGYVYAPGGKDSTGSRVASAEKYNAPNTGGGASGTIVSGTVVNQEGEPIENATVEVYGSKKSTASAAYTNLSTLSDPIPDEFETQVDDGFSPLDEFSDLDAHYVAIYTADEAGIASWSDEADLSDPDWRQLDPTDEHILVIADPTEEGGLGGTGILENEYDNDIPGHTVDEGTVVLERIAADGSVTQKLELNLSSEARTTDLDPSVLHYARLESGTLVDGYYRVTARVDGSESAFSYYIRVGDPLEVINRYHRDVNNQLTNLANDIRSAQSASDGVVRYTTTTNSTGDWNVSVDSSVKVVHVQAYKAPDVPETPSNLTLANISDAYSGDDVSDGAVYMPSKPVRVEPPESDVRVELVELSFPAQGGELSKLLDLVSDLRDLLENLTRAGEVPAQLEALSEETRSELESTYESLRSLVEANPDVREVYLDLSSRDSIADADELTRSELETEIGYMSTALRTVDSTGVSGGGGFDGGETVETGNETVSVSWETEIPDGAVVEVFVDYSNGTTEVVDDQYITVDRRAGRTDVVSVEEYPLGSTDPAQAAFRLTVSSSEGVVRETTPVTNPTFNGNLPEIRAIDFSTLRPGPDENVSVRILGNDEVRKVVSATVYAPNGSKITPSVNGSTVKFTTAGKGMYKIRYTVQNVDGQNFTTATTVRAAAKDRPMPATVRAREGMLGAYVAVGENLEDGELELDGGTLRITAQIPDGADAPKRIHIHVEDLSTAASNVQIAVVEGDDRRSVDEHIIVKYHTGSLADSTLVWRGPDEPITRDGETRFGEVTTRQNGSTIHTYTRSTGEVDLEIVRDPGILDRVEHRVDVIRANFNLPGVVAAPVDPLTSASGLAPRGAHGATLAPVLALGAAALLLGGGRT